MNQPRDRGSKPFLDEDKILLDSEGESMHPNQFLVETVADKMDLDMKDPLSSPLGDDEYEENSDDEYEDTLSDESKNNSEEGYDDDECVSATASEYHGKKDEEGEEDAGADGPYKLSQHLEDQLQDEEKYLIQLLRLDADKIYEEKDLDGAHHMQGALQLIYQFGFRRSILAFSNLLT